MQRGDAWRPVAERVAQRYPSTCLDFRTHTFEERLGEIAAAVSPGDALVGYSMGGRLALHAALRDAGPLAALALVGASAGIEDDAARAARARDDEQLAVWMEEHTIEEVVDRWERQPVFATQSPDLVGQQRSGRLAHDPAELATLLRSAGQGACEPVWGRLSELACPLVALAGEEDERYAEAAVRMAELVPGGRARLIPGAGHAPQLEAPDATAEALLELLDEHLG